MAGDLDRLAAEAGIVRNYTTLTGGTVHVSDDAVRGLLKAMGIACDSDAEIAESLTSHVPVPFGPFAVPEGVHCYMPDWLRDGRCWGVTCQLYGLRSERNWGIGDFDDLARFAEIVAAAGGDFLGVNPLHALFFAAPEGCSPFWPSSRRFLNPLYIAVDKAPGAERLGEALDLPDSVRSGDLVDYAAVGSLKRRALGRLYRIVVDGGRRKPRGRLPQLRRRGRRVALPSRAVRGAVGDDGGRRATAPTWPGWPEAYRHPANEAVKAFAQDQHDLIMFHCWLQWVAGRQLAEAQHRAPRGRDADRPLSRLRGRRRPGRLRHLVGPRAARARRTDRCAAGLFQRRRTGLGAVADFARRSWPSATSGRSATRSTTVLAHAGALRIDHAMSLYRLFWIAHGFSAADGAYVRYPFADLVRTVAEVSEARQAIVIGEDLGIVPEGFREAMHAADIQSYRVLFFEKRDDHFLPADAYPREALACITTHDTQTLAGWWSGHDLATRAGIGMIAAGGASRRARRPRP